MYCTTVPHSSGIVEHRGAAAPACRRDMPSTLTPAAMSGTRGDAGRVGQQSVDDDHDHTSEPERDADPLPRTQALAEQATRRPPR